MSNAPATDDRKAITAEAARWLALAYSGEMSQNDSRALRGWIDAAPAHAEAWQRMERLWYVTGATADDPAISAVRGHDAEQEEQERAAAMAASRRWRFGRWPTAIAASVALAFAGTWAIGGDGPLAELRGAGVQTLRTGLGQRSTVTLADGSAVTLDTDSEVQVQAMGSTRRLALTRGRALFKVAPNKARPFVVEAGRARVHALGTAFAVRLDGDALTVTLVEGRIRVEEPRALFRRGLSADMMPGAELTAAAANNWTIRPVDTDQEVSWVEGQLTFTREPLAHAIAEVNRYSERKVMFTGGRVPDERIVGAFRTGDVESFAQAAELNGFGRIVARTSTRIELMAE